MRDRRCVCMGPHAHAYVSVGRRDCVRVSVCVSVRCRVCVRVPVWVRVRSRDCVRVAACASVRRQVRLSDLCACACLCQ
jgi:ribosomal protein L39E